MTTTIPSLYQLRSSSVLLLVIILLYSACKSENKSSTNDTSKLVKTYYLGGEIKSEIYYIDDTIKDGKATFYYKGGSVARKCFYKNDELDSIYIDYYSSGIIKEKGTFEKGSALGSFFYYYPNGKVETYNAKDYENETFYVLKFDSLGNRLYEEGLVISPTAVSPTYKEQYVQGDSIVLLYQIAQPPGYKPKVFIGMYKYVNEDDRSLIGHFNETTIDLWSRATYRYKFNNSGHYRVVCAGQLIDTTNAYVKMDTTYQDFFISK